MISGRQKLERGEVNGGGGGHGGVGWAVGG